MIGIALDREVVAAGGFLTGSVQWAAGSGKQVTRVLAILEWRTGGAGNRAHAVARGAELLVTDGQRDGTFPFRLLIPYEGPVSFQAEWVSVYWVVRARLDQSGFDEEVETELRVVPRGAGAEAGSDR